MFLLLTVGAVFSVIFVLGSNDSNSVKLSLGSSLQYCHTLPDPFE